MIFWILAAIAVPGAVLAYPFVRDRMRPLPDYRQAPGRFADLSQGRTHYRLFGHETGPLFVGVHGLSTPCAAYQALAERIAGAGGRVLVYDLYGRGYSDRVGGLQDADFHQRQLNDLLDHLGVTQKFVIMGYSMGGMIATQFAAAQPERTNGIVLLTATGTLQITSRSLGVIKSARLFGAWFYLVSGIRDLAKGIEAARGEAVEVDGIHDIQAAQIGMRGYGLAVVNSVIGMIGEALPREHRKIAETGIPVMAFWGAKDDVIPLAAKDPLADWNPQAQQVVIDAGGHGLPYTHSAEVAAEILKRWPV